ncbi:MAG: hypothetical protein QOJ76_685 [Acidobacteriota bacterium]|nr:hypothetical protein [Acidobacteriota bacterium]
MSPPPRTPGKGSSLLTGKALRLASRLRAKLIGRQPTAAATLDLSAPEVSRDPFPHYENLRRDGPVHFLPRQGFWLVVGYNEVYTALMRPEVFSNRVSDYQQVDRVLLGTDPPEHAAARRVVGRIFSAQALEAQAPFVERDAERLLRPLLAGEPFEVMRDFAAPLVEDTAAHLIGFDESAVASIRAAHVNAPHLQGLFDSLDSIIEDAADQTHVYDRLLRSGEAGLAGPQARSLIRLLWIAGTTTTRRAIASSVLLLLRHTEARRRVESEPSLLPAFVEESLRLHPPERMLSRVAADEAELSGVKIAAGASVKLCVAAANRDPSRFERPASLLLERTPNRQLSFSGGIHRCVGAALARTEMLVALRVLLRLAPGFRTARPLDTLGYAGFANDTERLEIEC